MGRILLIIIIILFLYGCARNDELKLVWNHFWCLTEESSEQQNPTILHQEYKTSTISSKKSIDDIIDKDGLIKYKLQKKPLVTNGDIPYELVWR